MIRMKKSIKKKKGWTLWIGTANSTERLRAFHHKQLLKSCLLSHWSRQDTPLTCLPTTMWQFLGIAGWQFSWWPAIAGKLRGGERVGDRETEAFKSDRPGVGPEHQSLRASALHLNEYIRVWWPDLGWWQGFICSGWYLYCQSDASWRYLEDRDNL